MNLYISGLRVIRSTDRGTFIESEVIVESGDIAGVVTSLLASLPDGSEISVPDPGQYECYNECQLIDGSLQIKRGCHGSYGIWRPASSAEALEWLLPGFKLSASNPRLEKALVRIYKR